MIQVSISDPWNIYYITTDDELQKCKITMLIVMVIILNSKDDFCKHRNLYQYIFSQSPAVIHLSIDDHVICIICWHVFSMFTLSDLSQ